MFWIKFSDEIRKRERERRQALSLSTGNWKETYKRTWMKHEMKLERRIELFHFIRNTPRNLCLPYSPYFPLTIISLSLFS